MSESELPRWSLEGIYPSVDSVEFDRDIKRLYDIVSEIESIGHDSSCSLKHLLSLNDQGEAYVSNLMAYTEALLSTDTSNSAYLKAFSRAEDAAMDFSSSQDIIVENVSRRESEFCSPELEEYALTLKEIMEKSRHQMSLEEERLAKEMLKVSSSAWSRLQSSITSSIEKDGKTLNELRALAFSEDRSVRENAFRREIEILKEHEIALSSALNGVKGTVLILEKRRKWPSPLDRSLFDSRISKESFEALLEALEESISMFSRYFHRKAELLGLERLDFYDLFAPVGKSGREYTFDEAMDIVEASYYGFSKETGDFIKRARKSNWIDAEMRKGKSGGAYDTYFPLKKESRIFLNFDGSFDSLFTLAHELGHAYHDSVISELPLSWQRYPMTLAETASIFGENLLFESLIETLSEDQRLRVIESYVQSASQVCIDILSRYYFENEVFERRSEGELTPGELNEIMVRSQERAYGDELGEKHPYMWAVKSHYYAEDFSFYNYPYAFGELFALGLFSLRESSDDFPSLYKRVLSLTGRMDAVELSRSVGLNIEDREFWKRGLSVIDKYIKELEK